MQRCVCVCDSLPQRQRASDRQVIAGRLRRVDRCGLSSLFTARLPQVALPRLPAACRPRHTSFCWCTFRSYGNQHQQRDQTATAAFPSALLLSPRPLKMEKFYVIVWWMAVKVVLSYSASCAGFAFSHWDVVFGVTSLLFLTY